jgi:DNA polymerase III delta subunit-like protein
MHSYIFNQFSFSQIIDFLNNKFDLNLDANNLINHPDVIHIKPEINPKNKTKTSSIKIDDIRNLNQLLNKHPLKLKNQIAIIEQADSLTTAAQNSFLKLLEEPHHQSIIILSTQNFKNLLSTIQSRCQIILSSSKYDSTNINLKEIQDINKLNTVQRLVFIEKYQTDKQLAQDWLKKSIEPLRHQTEFHHTLQHLIKAYQDLQSNCNLKLTLDNLMINWSEQI